MLAKVWVTLKNGVLDPQGKTIQHALHSTGYEGIKEVKVGKYFEINLTDTDEAKAKEKLAHICKDMLSNPVIEDYRLEIITDKA